MKRNEICLARGKSHDAWRGRLFWKMHQTHLHFYLQADSAVPVIQIMSQQQRNCCEKQIIKPTGAENMLLLLHLKKKLQVSHLTSTTKSWGGRNCYKNVIQQALILTVVWWWVFWVVFCCFFGGFLVLGFFLNFFYY